MLNLSTDKVTICMICVPCLHTWLLMYYTVFNIQKIASTVGHKDITQLECPNYDRGMSMVYGKSVIKEVEFLIFKQVLWMNVRIKMVLTLIWVCDNVWYFMPLLFVALLLTEIMFSLLKKI